MTEQEELVEANMKLDAAERALASCRKQIVWYGRIEAVIVAAGLLDQEKFVEARDLILSTD